jgi:hypothetical protein
MIKVVEGEAVKDGVVEEVVEVGEMVEEAVVVGGMDRITIYITNCSC